MSNDLANIKGGAALLEALQQLPAKLEANVMRGAMRAGAKPVAEEARQRVHKVSGELEASIRIATSSRGGVVRAMVRAGSKKAWYARLVEKGTKAHWIKARKAKSLFFGGKRVKKVKHPGARAHPYLRPALDTKGQAAVQAMAAYIRKRLATKHGIDVPDPEADEGAEP